MSGTPGRAAPLYNVLSGDPGIFCEVYLPKKAEYQQILYDTLTEGFDRELVKEYLRRNRSELDRFFAPYGTDRLLAQEIGDHFNPMYYGYSMYEVDGVFYNSDHPPSDPRSREQERTQVIRVMFRFNGEDWCPHFGLDLKAIQRIARIFFRNQSSKTGVVEWHYLTQHKNAGDSLSPEEKTFLEFLSTWHDRVTLFVFGFLVHKVSRRIGELYAGNKVPRYEYEIWATQFWNININRVMPEPT